MMEVGISIAIYNPLVLIYLFVIIINGSVSSIRCFSQFTVCHLDTQQHVTWRKRSADESGDVSDSTWSQFRQQALASHVTCQNQVMGQAIAVGISEFYQVDLPRFLSMGEQINFTGSI